MNNISYKDYIISGLDSLSKNFSVKTYKLACQEEWMGFERGKDARIQIQWKGKCIWEWVLEKSFWVQRNTNKEDRVWMRKHADTKLNAIRKAMVKKTPSPTKLPLPTKTKNRSVGHTQVCFDKIKKK